MSRPSVAHWFSSHQSLQVLGKPEQAFPTLAQYGTLLAAGLIAAIAALDLWGAEYVRNNYSILYVVPLILLVHAGNARHLWQWAWLTVGLTFGVHFLKNYLTPLTVDPAYFDFRLINRAFAAAMILAVSKMLEYWVAWQDEQADADVDERAQDEEVASTLAAICFAPMIVVIAILDFLLPAHINVAILYPIPLFVAGWARSQALLWGTVAALLLLTVLAFHAGPESSVANLYFGLERQRVLAAVAMLAVAFHMHLWLAPQKRREE